MTTELLEQNVLLNVAFRSFVLLALTWAAALICRRRSAAVTHHVWVLGFCGSLLVPIVTLLAPHWRLPLLPPAEPVPVVATPIVMAVDTPADAVAPAFAAAAQTQPVESSHAVGRHIEQPQPAEQMTGVKPFVAMDGERVAWPSPATWLVIAWGAGTTLALLRLAWHVLAVRLAVRRCPTIENESWQALRDAVARQLGLRQPIGLRSHPAAVSPMVVGFWRPVVLLPRDAGNWSAQRRRQVLLHELAHVERGDLLTQSIAAWSCALYWFNPLAWWGAAQMRRLRELACDDAVVMHTTDPTEYAQTLLDVAKDYRCRQRAFTLAMARTPNVESRILAILDATRRRASLSKRSARIVGIAALVVSAVVGTVQLVSRAGEKDSKPAEKYAAGEAAKEESRESRKMTVRVRDERGRPIAGANIHVSLWEIDPDQEQFPGNRDFPTSDMGVAEFEIPRRLMILRIWASKANFVAQVVGFEEGMHEDGRLIPDTFDFALKSGHRLSGTVVDVDGKPIAGASVQVMVEVEESTAGNPKPVINTWLAEGEETITGEDGRWEITNAPAKKEGSDYEFRLQVTHPEFAGDTNWGGLQEAQEITTDQLRAGTARLKLDRGVSLSGTVTGTEDKPVTKGLVIWHDHPYWAQGVNEAPLDEGGHYQTRHLAPGKYPITVLAPGFAPEQRTIVLKQPREHADFQLERGHPIRIQIEDPSGKPIPKAYVQIGKWHGTEAIYNHKHPNVPDSGIPDAADENGLYIWDWAPADAVEYEIFAKGYDSKSVRLVAKDEPHHVQLAPEMTISGKVIDAKSGEPVARFRVIPVTAFRPDDHSTDFQAGSVAEGKDGQYRIAIDSNGRADHRYRVRIEAEGYRTALGRKSLAVGDAPLQEDFRLEPAPALTGTVLEAGGKPADAFTVAVGTPTAPGHFHLGRIDASFNINFEVLGSNIFKLPATFELSRIRVFNDSGFAEVLRQPDEQIGTITLQPWASVSGHLMQDGNLVPNEYIYFHPLAEHALTDARFQDSFTAKTDRNGHFRFDRLPPMSGSVRALLGPWHDSPLTSSKSVPLVLKAGDHREVALGGDGARITGRVVATGRSNDALSKQWSINYLISRGSGVDYPRDARPLSFSFAGPVEPAWLRHPDFRDWLATRENYYVKLTEDGRLLITGVQPGAYDLVVQLYEQPAGCLVETIGEKIVPVTITKHQVAAGQVALGEIEVACHIGPRVGSDMRAFQFTDADGRARYIDDMKGRHVLFHVWASWCEPCRASMPELKAAVEKHAGDRFTVVGLNIDKDAAAARALAKKDGLNWAQNYLADDSDLMRQLGVSSVPAYYLIGPDGKLVGSSGTWAETEKLLRAELR